MYGLPFFRSQFSLLSRQGRESMRTSRIAHPECIVSMNDDDLALFARFREQGVNEAAYAALRQRYRGMIRTELHRRCRGANYHDLEDLEEEVWINIWRALPRFEGRSAFSTWLVGVARNVVGAWLRRQRTDALGLLRLQELNEVEHEHKNRDDSLARESIHLALEALPGPENQVLTLRYFQHLADPEIANNLHLALGTVKGRIRRGLGHLRESLKQDLPASFPPRPQAAHCF